MTLKEIEPENKFPSQKYTLVQEHQEANQHLMLSVASARKVYRYPFGALV